MKVALVCISKDEENYLDEWIKYHTLIGIDDIFVYQNDWRFHPNERYDNLHLIEFDGECKQLKSYNDFISKYSKDFDFGIFIDSDEFICLSNGEKSIKGFLNKIIDKDDIGGVALNWRLFGDNGIETVEDCNYSLLKRFTKCEIGMNQHVKVIINFTSMRKAYSDIENHLHFINPHCIYQDPTLPKIVNSNFTRTVVGPFNQNEDVNCANAWINHYFCKTREEFMTNKYRKGKADFVRSSPMQSLDTTLFDSHNKNEIECTIARDLYAERFG